jgi:predicted chitinase
MIAFGHPTAVECGECTEIRVQRLDGSYNTIVVMTTDNPGSGGTTSSPELTTAGKDHLTEGTGKQLGDRLPFEWRKVDCAPGVSQPTPPPTPPQPTPQPSGEVCTGDAEADQILTAPGVIAASLLEGSSVYTWGGFCSAARAIAQVGLPLHSGTGSGASRVAQMLTNIASLLAQSMWESGGDAPWSACDENNYLGIETAPCTQRGDGQRYDSLTGPPACTVDKQMHMVAETWASWTPGPMSCVPGTVTEGCCWWGRGAIQTTGPHNYKMLQQEVVSKIPSFESVDLCANPEAICQHDELKMLGAMYYWSSVVQNAAHFKASLDAYVATGFSDEGSVVGGASFNAGTGGMVNNGFWAATPHGNSGRMAYFRKLVSAMRAAGMGQGLVPVEATPAPTGCAAVCQAQGETCYVASWAVPCFTPGGGEAECSGYEGEFCG